MHTTAHLCAQAAVSSAEQQVSSLEAALQKNSQVTLSMTEKVAQTLSAANAQTEALKVGAGVGDVCGVCAELVENLSILTPGMPRPHSMHADTLQGVCQQGMPDENVVCNSSSTASRRLSLLRARAS